MPWTVLSAGSKSGPPESPLQALPPSVWQTRRCSACVVLRWCGIVGLTLSDGAHHGAAVVVLDGAHERRPDPTALAIGTDAQVDFLQRVRQSVAIVLSPQRSVRLGWVRLGHTFDNVGQTRQTPWVFKFIQEFICSYKNELDLKLGLVGPTPTDDPTKTKEEWRGSHRLGPSRRSSGRCCGEPVRSAAGPGRRWRQRSAVGPAVEGRNENEYQLNESVA